MNVHSDAKPYVLVEHGQQNQMYGADALVSFHWWLMPLFAADASTMGETLFTRRVHWWDCWAGYEMAWGLPHRHVSAIRERARVVSPAPFWVGDAKQTEAPKRWILGNEPLVIAIGTELGPIEWDERTYSLVREGDLERTATELVVLDMWPKVWKNTGSEEERELVAAMAKVTRRIKLERPITLREILGRRLWEQAPAATTEPVGSDSSRKEIGK